MTKDLFWQVIQGSFDRCGGDIWEQADALKEELEPLSPEDVVSFDRHFDALMRESYSRDLWGAAYIVAGGCSDDGFEYFRRWLISRGREWFERVLKNPDDLAEYPGQLSDSEIEFEDIAYVARNVYEERVGKSMPNESPQPYVLRGED